jgi:hypothetical protein
MREINEINKKKTKEMHEIKRINKETIPGKRFSKFKTVRPKYVEGMVVLTTTPTHKKHTTKSPLCMLEVE